MAELRRYAQFLKENYVDDLIREQLRIIATVDLPMMKYFQHLSEAELIEQSRAGWVQFLTSLGNGTALEDVKKSLADWEADKLGWIRKEDIQPSDLVQVYATQEKTLIRFVDKYTESSKEAVTIISKLNEYYMQASDLAFNVLFRIRKEAEASLAESEARFRSFTQSASDGIVITNEEGRVVFSNNRMDDMLAFEKGELIDKEFISCLPLRQRPEFIKKLKSLLSSQKEDSVEKNSYETLCQDKTGKKIPVEISMASWNTQRGRYYGYIIHDISERKSAEEKLKKKAEELSQSNAELEQFAYVASHDLKEPLRMVSNYTQLLQQTYADKLDNTANDYINFAVDGVRRMNELINDLLSYSRMNKDERSFEPVDLNELLMDVKASMAQSLEESRAEIRSEELPVVSGDRAQLFQVFQNLIGNALKFNNNEPIIEIGSVSRSRYQVISIKDNGIGIDPAYLKKIFIMFQRLHSQKEYPGTGIGLAICKKIIERHGGKVNVQSTPGEGSTFSFTLRAAKEADKG